MNRRWATLSTNLILVKNLFCSGAIAIFITNFAVAQLECKIYFAVAQLECKIYFAAAQLECKIYFATANLNINVLYSIGKGYSLNCTETK